MFIAGDVQDNPETSASVLHSLLNDFSVGVARDSLAVLRDQLSQKSNAEYCGGSSVHSVVLCKEILSLLFEKLVWNDELKTSVGEFLSALLITADDSAIQLLVQSLDSSICPKPESKCFSLGFSEHDCVLLALWSDKEYAEVVNWYQALLEGCKDASASLLLWRARKLFCKRPLPPTSASGRISHQIQRLSENDSESAVADSGCPLVGSCASHCLMQMRALVMSAWTLFLPQFLQDLI